jgi:hypothetical protein
MGSERGRAMLAGLGAIGLWALLAPLRVAAGPVPPFLLTALSFAVGGTVGLVLQLAGGHSTAALPASPRALGCSASAPSSATTRSTSPHCRLCRRSRRS